MIPISDYMSYDPDTGLLVFAESVSKGKKWNKSHPGNVAGSIDEKGYVRVYFEGRKWKAHRLIATNFIPNPENKPIVNHKNGDKQYNHASNLEWNTVSENTSHAWSMGLRR